MRRWSARSVGSLPYDDAASADYRICINGGWIVESPFSSADYIMAIKTFLFDIIYICKNMYIVYKIIKYH